MQIRSSTAANSYQEIVLMDGGTLFAVNHRHDLIHNHHPRPIEGACSFEPVQERERDAFVKLAWQKKFLHRAKQFFHCTRITARPFSRHQGIFLPTATCHPRQHTTEHRRAGSRARKEVEIVILTADHKRGG